MAQSTRLMFALMAFWTVGLAQAQYEVPDPEDPNVQAQQQRSVTQPGNNAPVWRDVRSGQEHFTDMRGREMGVLIQSAGETWRQIRNGPVTFYGGWLLVLILLAILVFYFTFGAVKLHDRPSGRLIRRFSTVDQLVHWSVAISFCVLGLSGLIMFFGKYLLLPVIGYTLFGLLAGLAKNLHNFIAPLFIVSVIAMVALYVRHNLPKSYDFQFLINAWNVMARGKHVPSGKFNAGEKLWFWGGVVGLSVIVIWSGLILLFPNFDQTRAVMQEAWIWHVCAALLYVSISFGHIYLGTIGLEGSYQAMRTGDVDEVWAREHHEYWYNEVKSKVR